MFAIKYITYVI